MSKAAVKLIGMPAFEDGRGRLVVFEGELHVPFPIVRVFTVAGVPAATRRGKHAHRVCWELVVVAQGRVTIDCEGADGAHRYELTGGDVGLVVPPLTWIELTDFSPDAVLVVFCSHRYDAADYIWDKDELRALFSLGKAS